MAQRNLMARRALRLGTKPPLPKEVKNDIVRQIGNISSPKLECFQIQFNEQIVNFWAYHPPLLNHVEDLFHFAYELIGDCKWKGNPIEIEVPEDYSNEELKLLKWKIAEFIFSETAKANFPLGKEYADYAAAQLALAYQAQKLDQLEINNLIVSNEEKNNAEKALGKIREQIQKICALDKSQINVESLKLALKLNQAEEELVRFIELNNKFDEAQKLLMTAIQQFEERPIAELDEVVIDVPKPEAKSSLPENNEMLNTNSLSESHSLILIPPFLSFWKLPQASSEPIAQNTFSCTIL